MSNYSRIKFCASWAMVLVLVFVLGCSPEEPQGTLVSQSYGSHSQVKGKEYDFKITKETLKDSPDWSVGKTIPLTISDAVRIAELEISNYSTEKDLWHLTGIELMRFGLTDKWLYVIAFDKTRSRDSEMYTNDYLRIPVLFNGIPIKGK